MRPSAQLGILSLGHAPQEPCLISAQCLGVRKEPVDVGMASILETTSDAI